jgi:hypothetical protein
MRPCHGHSDGFLFEDDRETTTLGSSCIGHRFTTDGLDDMLERLGVLGIIKP